MLVAFAARYRQRTVLKMEDHELQSFDYYLDESDPDIVMLRRQDGSFVAAFSAPGVLPRRALSRLPRRTTGPCSRSARMAKRRAREPSSTA